MKIIFVVLLLSIYGFRLDAQEIGDVDYEDYEDYELKFKITSIMPPECIVDVIRIYSEDAEIIVPSSALIDEMQYAVTEMFGHITSGKSVKIANTVKVIKEYSHIGGNSLSTIEFDNNSQLSFVENSLFVGSVSLTSIDFGDNSQLRYIEGHKGVTGVFNNCISLTNIDFGKNSKLVAIGDGTEHADDCGVFSNCISLKEIELPYGITKLGSYIFSGCSSLTDINFEDCTKLDTVGEYAFKRCSSLQSIDLSKCTKLKRIDAGTFFDCTSLEDVRLPSSIEYIEYGALENCTSLKEIEFPTGITELGSSIFSGCSSLVDINFEDCTKLDIIGSYAFEKCSSLRSIDLSKCTKIKRIDTGTFFDCTSLEDVRLPNSIECIDNYAFENCSKLKSIKCYAENVPITGTIFDDCPSDMIIYVPEKSMSLYKSDYVWGQFTIKSLESLGIDNMICEENISINIYPDQTNNNIFIETDKNIQYIHVYNINGVLIKKSLPCNNLLNVSNLSDGIYLMKLKTDEGYVIKGFIKQ